MAKITENKIKEMVEKEGYKYFENEMRITNNRKRRFIKIQCPNNHNVYWTRYDVFKSGHRCEQCKNENYKGKWNKENIIKYIEDKKYNFIRFIQFDKVLSEIEIECPKEHKYSVVFKKFLEDRRCPYCKESKGEKEISNILNKYNIEYIPQYKFNDCKFYNCLPFDFYLPKYNVCIEFDGKQHYEIVEYWGGFDRFVDTIIRDTIKNDYCKRKEIKLIRIPYWEKDNIEKIVVNKLKLE